MVQGLVRLCPEGSGAVEGAFNNGLKKFSPIGGRSSIQPKRRRTKSHGARAVRKGSFRRGRRATSRQVGLLALSDVLQQKKGGLRRPMSEIYVFFIVNASPVARFRCAHRLSALHALSDTHNKRGTHSYHRPSPGPGTPRLQMPRKQVEPGTRNAWPNL